MYIVKNFVSGKYSGFMCGFGTKKISNPISDTNWQILGKLPNLPRLCFLYLEIEILTRLILYCD